MNHPATILILGAVLIFCYGLVSRLAERSPVTAPMVFVAIGIVASPLGTGILSVKIDAALVQIIASVTLVLVLFVDASTISVPSLIRERRLPMRLLLIGFVQLIPYGGKLAEPKLFGGDAVEEGDTHTAALGDMESRRR